MCPVRRPVAVLANHFEHDLVAAQHRQTERAVVPGKDGLANYLNAVVLKCRTQCGLILFVFLFGPAP
jgi:hypothetical protein